MSRQHLERLSLRQVQERAAIETVRELVRANCTHLNYVRIVAGILQAHTNTVRWYMKKADINRKVVEMWQEEQLRQKELFKR